MTVLPANTDAWNQPSSRPGPEWSRLWPVWLRTPKSHVLVVFGVLLAIAAPAQPGSAILPHLAAAVLGACLVEGAFMYLESSRPVVPTSALITGLIVAFVLDPVTPTWISAGTAAVAIVGKHVLRTQREHVFNPAALALLAAALLFGSGESWWGALAGRPWPWIGAMLLGGVLVVDRLNKLPLVFSFAAVYFSLFGLASIANPAAVAEMFRDPFVQSALFLALFMLSDPPTSPNRYPDQVWFGVVAAATAVLAQLLGAGQIFLLLGVLAANAWLVGRRWWARRPSRSLPPPVGGGSAARPSSVARPLPRSRSQAVPVPRERRRL
jgi:Na+-translocating ferredoxin:NAD+ oxidoreductase RnfD subunit